MEGIIYILINEAMPGYTKIGKTTTSVEQRMRELDTTGLPLTFECFYAAKVANVDLVERKLHDAFRDRRVRPRREFFRVDPERVRSALEIAGGEDATPRHDVVEDADDQTALNKARERRSIELSVTEGKSGETRTDHAPPQWSRPHADAAANTRPVGARLLARRAGDVPGSRFGCHPDVSPFR